MTLRKNKTKEVVLFDILFIKRHRIWISVAEKSIIYDKITLIMEKKLYYCYTVQEKELLIHF